MLCVPLLGRFIIDMHGVQLIFCIPPPPPQVDTTFRMSLSEVDNKQWIAVLEAAPQF